MIKRRKLWSQTENNLITLQFKSKIKRGFQSMESKSDSHKAAADASTTKSSQSSDASATEYITAQFLF